MTNALRWLQLAPVDSWMFRDGRPFNQSDEGASEAVSVFPPWPPTIVGAVRAALWKGPLCGKWNKDKLGNGTDWSKSGTLGPLSFSPPLLRKGDETLFPMPLHILQGPDGNLTRLAPGPGLDCDLGKSIHLPVVQTPMPGMEPLEDHFVTMEDMKRILADGLPGKNDIVKSADVFARENRVGIGIDPATRRVNQSQLYMATHVRPAGDVSLAIGISGYDDGLPEGLVPFGGEHRAAQIGQPENGPDLPALPPGNGNKVMLVAISPVVFEGGLPQPGDDLAGMGKVVSACIGKPVRIGGWDSNARRSLGLRHAVPAGSVWFLEGDAALPEDGIARLGMATEWGFGWALAGRWKELENDKT
jgi:CRISPR-associated protein Cmr3